MVYSKLEIEQITNILKYAKEINDYRQILAGLDNEKDSVAIEKVVTRIFNLHDKIKNI